MLCDSILSFYFRFLKFDKLDSSISNRGRVNKELPGLGLSHVSVRLEDLSIENFKDQGMSQIFKFEKNVY